MGFEIDDTDLPCTAAGVGGVLVPEVLNILEVCQDPTNLSIVYLKCTIQGAYVYQPTLTICWDGNELQVDDLYVSGWQGEGETVFPINPECGSTEVTLAYNIGPAVPNFVTVAEIEFKLKFLGSAVEISDNPIIQDTFKSIDPEAKEILKKGLNPQPYKLYYDAVSGKLKVQYLNLGDTPCKCSINCIEPEEEDLNITVCKDEVQELTVDANSLVGNPTLVELTFVDDLGNKSHVNIEALINMEPVKPDAFLRASPNRVNVSFVHASVHGVEVSPKKLSYQVLRFENHIDSARVWKDWSSGGTTAFIDTDIVSGKKYGYAVRFKGEFGEFSKLSGWSTVEVP